MKAGRHKQILDNQTAIARKVLSVIPTFGPWDAHQIVAEMTRLGSRPDKHIVMGCLRALLDAGLVKECRQGYTRIEPSDSEEVARLDAPTQPASNPEPARPTLSIVAPPELIEGTTGPAFAKLVESASEPETPIDRLALVAARLRVVADTVQGVSGTLMQLATEAEDAAIAAEEHLTQLRASMDDLHQQTSKVRQLQELLRSF